uniref:NADH dehydrogenase subunit 6 n=1 Tax=Rhynchophorus phoenicis TaxID=206503 RepID=UPI0028FCA5FC|nr:NADH dehydrogenase subunit 6 [Rhynchophorus phoenicis]WNH29327.1 NADH dehydrogenase subunit 6 [Rhynchophorus phoenicis]
MMGNLIMLNIFSNFLFVFLKHPLSMGSILLIQTITISLLTGLFFLNFWFSYILFIIMVSGMLILFLYMTSVASDEKFKHNKLFYMPFSMMTLLIFSNMFYDDFTFMKISIHKKLWETGFNYSSNFFFLSKYIYYPNMLMMMLLMVYLFLTLILVVKLTDIYSGPLRQKF